MPQKKRRARAKKKPVMTQTSGRGSADRPHPNRLRELRMRGTVLSQGQLARLMDCDDATISRDESGMMPMSRDRVAAYATIFRVPTHEIFITPEGLPPVVEHHLNSGALPEDFQAPGPRT